MEHMQNLISDICWLHMQLPRCYAPVLPLTFSIIIYGIQIQIRNIHNSAKSVNKVEMAVINSCKRLQYSDSNVAI